MHRGTSLVDELTTRLDYQARNNSEKRGGIYSPGDSYVALGTATEKPVGNY